MTEENHDFELIDLWYFFLAAAACTAGIAMCGGVMLGFYYMIGLCIRAFLKGTGIL